MYRVLLPVDEKEDRARKQAEAVLDLPGGADEVSVDVVYVHEDRSGPDAEWAAGGFADAFEEAMNEDLEDRRRLPNSVDAAVEPLESGGIECAVHEASGDPAGAILAIADEYDSDAIVIGVRNRSPIGKVLFGSVAQGVILDSERPVTVVPSE
jgi:nucleotide-binding universal stress UspA family protein